MDQAMTIQKEMDRVVTIQEETVKIKAEPAMGKIQAEMDRKMEGTTQEEVDQVMEDTIQGEKVDLKDSQTLHANVDSAESAGSGNHTNQMIHSFKSDQEKA